VLDVSAAAGDVASFQRACHSIAGAAGAVGALALEQASRLAMTQPDMVPAQLPGLHAGIAAWSAQALDETAAFLAALPAG